MRNNKSFSTLLSFAYFAALLTVSVIYYFEHSAYASTLSEISKLETAISVKPQPKPRNLSTINAPASVEPATHEKLPIDSFFGTVVALAIGSLLDESSEPSEAEKQASQLLWSQPNVALASVALNDIYEEADGHAEDIAFKFELDENAQTLLAAEVKDIGDNIASALLYVDDEDFQDLTQLYHRIQDISRDAEDRAVDIIGPERYNEKVEEYSQDYADRHQKATDKALEDAEVLSRRLSLTDEEALALSEALVQAEELYRNERQPREYHAMMCVECFNKKLSLLKYLKQSPDKENFSLSLETFEKEGPIGSSSYARARKRSQIAREQLQGVVTDDVLYELEVRLLTFD